MKLLNTAERNKRVLGERVMLPEFEIVSCPTMRLSEVRLKRFDIIERVQAYVADAIRKAFERTIFEEHETMPVIRREPRNI